MDELPLRDSTGSARFVKIDRAAVAKSCRIFTLLMALSPWD
jgi:hypothetical protein